MTAKELKEQARVIPMPGVDEKFNNRHNFGPGELDIFIDQLCREQRELCRDEMMGMDVLGKDLSRVLNAPKPTT